MKKKILQAVENGICALQQLSKKDGIEFIETGARLIADCFLQGRKLLIAGNGGSLCDAAHIAEEFTGYFRRKRRALPAIALIEPGHLTCVGNDQGFEEIFSRSIEALGRRGDIFIGLTTSGNSPNMVRAFQKAEERGLKTIAFLGKGGGKLKGFADLELLIENQTTSDRIQEAHMAAAHIMIEMVEEILFYGEQEELLEEILSTVHSHE